eukprot:m.186380 g.186380  ORF g.186380 m.186380 type:complete len:50 (+) comp39346_c0_seq9:550-699(+)
MYEIQRFNAALPEICKLGRKYEQSSGSSREGVVGGCAPSRLMQKDNSNK